MTSIDSFGSDFWQELSNRGTKLAKNASLVPIMTFCSVADSDSSLMAISFISTISQALFRNSLPARVRLTPLLCLLKSETPSCCSSFLICQLIADWTRCRRKAAFEKLLSSDTAMKLRKQSISRSIYFLPGYEARSHWVNWWPPIKFLRFYRNSMIARLEPQF